MDAQLAVASSDEPPYDAKSGQRAPAPGSNAEMKLMHQSRPTESKRGARLALTAITVLAASILVACERKCPSGFVKHGNWCQVAEGGVDAGDGQFSGAGGSIGAATAGTGSAMQAALAAGAGGMGKAKSPPLDPAVEWMCMKNAAGECTSCKQDADCPKHVCERGYCMECRDSSQCGAANSCISNRCVPERKPSSVWQVSGGGQTSAVGLKLQLSIGMSTPVTEAVVSGFKMSVAPGAGNF